MRCNSCGWNNPTGTMFCINCGTPAAVSSEPEIGEETAVKNLPRDDDTVKKWGKLIALEPDGSDGQVFGLSEETYLVGRGAAGIRFEKDQFLAWQHARIDFSDGDPQLTPLDSLNGVFFRLSEVHSLVDGDVILLGRHVFVFDSVYGQNDVHLVQQGTHLFASPLESAWGRLSRLAPNGALEDVHFLRTATICVGRGAGDIVIPNDPFLSGEHCEFRMSDKGATLTDLESSNGTFVRLRDSFRLHDRMEFRIGDHLFRYRAN